MPLIALLALLLLGGMCYLLFVGTQIAFVALRSSLGHRRNAGMIATTREEQPQSAGAKGGFTPGLRTTHLSIFGAFVLVYSLLAWSIWGGYYHTFKAILVPVCGPFTTAILDPTGEHWKTAWALFPFCAAFLAWGIFCQFVRLPFQHSPRQVALVMWATGLMVWFDAAIFSYVLAA
jgi:hypothetical protein